MKLHLACGPHKKEGYLNIDIAPESNADIIADMRQLNFGAASVDEIWMEHAIEHLTRREAIDLIGKFANWITPCGKVIIITPDFDANVQEYLKADAQKRLQHWICTIFGTQESEGQLHKCHFSLDTLREILQHFGFAHVDIESRYNDVRDMYELKAIASISQGNVTKQIPAGEIVISSPLQATHPAPALKNGHERSVDAEEASHPFVHIGVPTYKCPEECLRLVRSIEEHTKNYDLHIIVDSPGHNYNLLNDYPLIWHEQNQGLTKTWNELLLMHTPYDWICLINDDVAVKEDWLEALYWAMDNRTGIVGFEQWYEPNKRWCNYWVGSCFLINPQALRQVGIFDERFRLHAQDYDMYWRMEAAGWQVKAIQPCLIEHDVNAAISQVPDVDNIVDEDNRLLIEKYKTRHHEIHGKSAFDINWGD